MTRAERYRRAVSRDQGLQSMLTEHVVAIEDRQVDVDESLLWPEERAAIGEVVPGRWWDWVMGRRCARLALDRLGVVPEPVLSGEKRQPLWPGGVVGAITHTRGYVAAAVAHDHSRLSIGIDSEPDLPLPDGVLDRISLPEERAWVLADTDLGVANADRLLFCAKESIYKAWFPLAQSWLGFEDARVTVDASSASFEAEILVEGPLSKVRGRFGSVDGIVLTTIEVLRK